MGATSPTKTLFLYSEGFPACSAYIDGGWFKTRSGLTERAETIFVEQDCAMF